jgi:peptidoglycan hydrolase-like protein with peptidoglycan-binding domain
MILRLRDEGPPVKTLQRNLNKLGSILLIDGDFGPATRDAILDARATLGLPGDGDADEALQTAVAAVPDPFPPLTAAGVTFIARLEVSSSKMYRQVYCHPTLPPEASGITIGIGYDLRFASRASFEADWGASVPAGDVDRLEAAFGRIGSEALRASLSDLTIPLNVAMPVYLKRNLPQHLDLTRTIYPQVDRLPPSRRTALVSLVFNRGTKLDGDRRREMRAVRDLLAAGDLDPVADEFESMTRLWDPRSGLITRRRDEAKLWRSGFSALQLD